MNEEKSGKGPGKLPGPRRAGDGREQGAARDRTPGEERSDDPRPPGADAATKGR